MSFLDDLREYLRGVEKGVIAPAHDEGVTIDMAAARRHFIEALERVEARSAKVPSGSEVEPRGLSLLHWQHWFGDEKLRRFVVLAEAELRQGLCAGDAIPSVQANVFIVIDALLGHQIGDVSRVREAEINRIAQHCFASVQHGRATKNRARYAFELRLVRLEGATRSELSPLGRVLLGLPDADAVQWLLVLETRQTLGREDEMHMHRDLIADIVGTPERTFYPDAIVGHDDDGAEIHDGDQWPFASEAFARLGELGVVERWDHSLRFLPGYKLNAAFLPMLEDILAQRRTPLSMLAETLLADERDTASGHAAVPAGRESSATLQARHARMVTHEIRSVIVPMRMALSGLYRTLDANVAAEQWNPQRERIERGVDRLFRFVADLEQVARLGSPPSAPFDVLEAVRDAIKGLNGGLALSVDLAIDADLPRVDGDRSRFTLAIVNLLRNAAQNSGRPKASVCVGATLSTSREQVIVMVDDDGPGVPEEHREEIFRQGFALRFGGSGQGLALVREVVEIEMRGKVRCEQSDLGGASFVLVVPVAAGEAP